MADTTIRWQVVQRVVDLAAAHESLRDVSVTSIWPGDTVGPERIYAADVDGRLDVAGFVGTTRAIYDDTFTITWGIEVVAAGKTVDECATRCAELVAALQDVHCDHPDFDNLDGVSHAVMGAQRGPSGVEFPGVGLIAVAQLETEVLARLAP